MNKSNEFRVSGFRRNFGFRYIEKRDIFQILLGSMEQTRIDLLASI